MRRETNKPIYSHIFLPSTNTGTLMSVPLGNAGGRMKTHHRVFPTKESRRFSHKQLASLLEKLSMPINSPVLSIYLAHGVNGFSETGRGTLEQNLREKYRDF